MPSKNLYVWQVALMVIHVSRPKLVHQRTYLTQASTSDEANCDAVMIASQDDCNIVSVVSITRGLRLKKGELPS